MNFNLAHPFFRNSIKTPDRLALVAEGVSLTYGELARIVRKIAAALRTPSVKPGRRVGILASRSIEACAGTLGACWVGATYVPISLKVPEERLLSILELGEFDALIADAKGARLLSERVLSACPKLILVPEKAACRQTPGGDARDIRAISALAQPTNLAEPAEVSAEHTAYIMFTSGTTGIPKGVMVPAQGVHHYVSVMQERCQLTPEDRVAEGTELSFDVSVCDMFMTWNAGASLHVLGGAQVVAPANFIREHGVTVWFLVPSVVALMKRVKAIRPGLLTSLRYSGFGGEALPLSSAIDWQETAPNSIIDNLYGPTENTVGCIVLRLSNPPAVTPERGIISIGYPFPGTEAAVVDSDLNFLPQGEHGELALAGPQLASGYFRAPELSAARFPEIGGKRWYLSGDLGYQDAAGRFHHLGRIDNQVKVLGQRIELEEIEAHLRAVAATELVAAVAWPVAHGTADGIVAFIAGKEFVPAEIRSALKRRLSSFMVPTAIHPIERLPLNANGKVDRKALIARLEAGLR